MLNANMFIFYVDNPTASKDFYQHILGQSPVEASDTFAMFHFSSDVLLGLWSKHTVEPKAGTITASGELGFAVESAEAVDNYYREWQQKGVSIIQSPQHMDFGYTFTAQDPDGHRLRVFAVA
ncbi:VOC family protein [Pragia fontium]|uniref:Phenazine antibiotic resistance protein n=1 Tax=Pragia fontium DSM 5563 = ATCC 49100 TaxID=1122977 RepID=A0AAJ5BHL9_9GAMM|nr:VOC family protein [Pragia fontium]SFD00607.1 Catechol 2,3-dioxygenase [Pragia fontium DSM 5563 = ATCC 49100]